MYTCTRKKSYRKVSSVGWTKVLKKVTKCTKWHKGSRPLRPLSGQNGQNVDTLNHPGRPSRGARECWSKVSTICPTNIGQKVSNQLSRYIYLFPPFFFLPLFPPLTLLPSYPLTTYFFYSRFSPYVYTCTCVQNPTEKCPAFVGQSCSKKSQTVHSRNKALSVHSLPLDKMDKMWILLTTWLPGPGNAWSKVSTICPTNLGQKVSNPLTI